MNTVQTDQTLQKHSKKLIAGYNDIRIWAVLLVIAGHSTTLGMGEIRVINPYAGMPGLYMQKAITLIHELIYGFHMPLFVMLSGAIFVVAFHHADLKAWIKKRARRLLVPYIAVACLLWEPVRLLVGYYSSVQDLFTHFGKDILLSMDSDFLWYVMMLFEAGVIMVLIYTYLWPKTAKGHILLFCILLFVSMAQNLMPTLPFQLNRTMKYTFWYYVGMMFEMHREELVARVRHAGKMLLFLSAAFFVSFACWYLLRGVVDAHAYKGILMFGIKLVKMGLDYLTAILGSAFFIVLAFATSAGKHFAPERIGRRAYQIYLYHVPCCIVFTWGVQKLIPPSAMTNSIFAFAVIIKFFVGLFGALAIDSLLLWLKRRFTAEKKIAA